MRWCLLVVSVLVCYANAETPAHGVVYTGYNPLSSWTADKIIGFFKSSSGVNAGVKAALVPAVKTATAGIVAAKKAAVKTAAVGVVAAKKAAVKTAVVGVAKKGLSSVGSVGLRLFSGGHGNGGGVAVAAPVPVPVPAPVPVPVPAPVQKITYASLLGRLGGLGKTGIFGSYGLFGAGRSPKAGVSAGVTVAAAPPSVPNGGNVPEPQPQLVQNGEQSPAAGGYGEEQQKYGSGTDVGEQNFGGEGLDVRQQAYANGGPGLPYGAPGIQDGQQSFGRVGGQFERGQANIATGGSQHELGQQFAGNEGVNANFDGGIGGNAGVGFDQGSFDDFSFDSGLGGAQYSQFGGFGAMLPGIQSNLKSGPIPPGGNEQGSRNLEPSNGYRNNGGQIGEAPLTSVPGGSIEGGILNNRGYQGPGFTGQLFVSKRL